MKVKLKEASCDDVNRGRREPSSEEVRRDGIAMKEPSKDLKQKCHNLFKALYTSRLRMRFPHYAAFSSLRCVFLVLTLIDQINVITRKTLCNVVYVYVNGMWQLGFTHVYATL